MLEINGYEIIAGERRFRASKLAKKKTIPAIIRDFDEAQMMEVLALMKADFLIAFFLGLFSFSFNLATSDSN